MKHFAFFLLFAARLAVADVPAPGCRSDVDCVISDFQGCCPGCCADAPKAWLRSELSRQELRCHAVDCGERACNIPCELPEKVPLVAVCAGGRCQAREVPRAKDPDFCASDADCISSTFSSCCGSCCPAQPVAVSRQRAQLQQARCATMRCASLECSNIACAQVVPSPIRPVCRANRCVAERPNLMPPPPPPPPPPVQCRVAADCGVDLNPPTGSACWSSPCGCCPLPRAVPIEQVRPPPVRRTPSTGQGSPFGLSQGNTQAAPSCGPCPAPSVPLSAGCSAGRCVLQPR